MVWTGGALIACGQGDEVKIEPDAPPARADVPSAVPSAAPSVVPTSLEAPPGEETRVNQCNRLIAVINASQEEVDKSDMAALDQLAKVFDDVAEDVAKVRLSDPELRKLQQEYITLAKALGEASRQVARALEGADPTAAAEAVKKMQSFGPKESQVVDRVNKYCSSP